MRIRILVTLLGIGVLSVFDASAQSDPMQPLPAHELTVVQAAEEGAELYKQACATCHGSDGSGADAYLLGFDLPIPDFTECVFASREPDGDWIGVAHEGGPVRGFSERMPAFGNALTEAQLQLVMDHIRTFCSDERWPRGELNLPRALFTEKAYPEDEAVITTTGEDGSVMSKFVYETRFGPRNQLEFVVPFGHREVAGQWRGMALGDIAVGLKRALLHGNGGSVRYHVDQGKRPNRLNRFHR